MIPDEVPQPRERGIGDNSGNPHQFAITAFSEALHDTPRDGGKTFAQRRSEFLASASKQTVRDRQSAADAGDTIKLAREFREKVVAERKALSDPFFQTHKTLTAKAEEFLADFDAAMRGLLDQIDEWDRAEDDRIEAQKREQAEELAKMRAENAPPPPPPAPASTSARRPAPMREGKRASIVGDLGAVVSQQQRFVYEIEDLSLVPRHILESPTVTDAILAVVRRTAKDMGVPAGIRAVPVTGNQVR